jgi:hypothetical protein
VARKDLIKEVLDTADRIAKKRRRLAKPYGVAAGRPL